MRKLSASALNTFLSSPRKFYWSHVKQLTPVFQSVGTYDHDRLCGILWAAYVDRFYKGIPEAENTAQMLTEWDEKVSGWVPDKPKEKLTKAMTAWASQYYQQFSKDDGVRNGSELYLENERFVAYLDGLSHDKIIHEVKSTSRSPQLSSQLWKIQRSTQVKLYCVMAEAVGIRIEFAWKDQPYQIYRSEVLDVSAEDRAGWAQELNGLADYIYSLGEDEHNYPCHTDGCNLITRNICSLCAYHTLCDIGYNEDTKILYQPKTHRT